MKLRLQFLFVLNCFFSFSGEAQTDSSDLNFYSMALNEQNTLYQNSDLKEIYLEFDLDSLNNLGVIHLELSVGQEYAIVLRKKITASSLSENNMLLGGHVTIYLGLYETNNSYKISLTIEGIDGSLSEVITKDLEVL